jgi:hypothetical protein
MTEHQGSEEAGSEIDPARLKQIAERVIRAGGNVAGTRDRAEEDRLLSEQLKADVADPSTWWRAYNSPPIGLVTPSTIRSTKPGREPTTALDAEHRKNKVGGPGGEQLGVPDAVLRKAGMVVKPRTPEIRRGLASGEGILLRFDQPGKPAARVVYFLDEAARRADVVALRNDGTIRVRHITTPSLNPRSFTVGESGQFDPAVDGKLSRLKLASVELPSTMMQRLGVIDSEGIPTTVPDDSANIQFERVSSPIDQARFALEAQAGLQDLPTAPPR